MKNHRFPWLRNRTTDNRKCEKARNIKEKCTIEMFSTASRLPVVRLSSASAKKGYDCPIAVYNSAGKFSCGVLLILINGCFNV